MKKTLFAIAAITISCAACNNKTNDKEASLKKLNDQSLECIRIMNKADANKNMALTNGDAAAASAFQKTMDSAALENVKIGQQMSELQSK